MKQTLTQLIEKTLKRFCQAVKMAKAIEIVAIQQPWPICFSDPRGLKVLMAYHINDDHHYTITPPHLVTTTHFSRFVF